MAKSKANPPIALDTINKVIKKQVKPRIKLSDLAKPIPEPVVVLPPDPEPEESLFADLETPDTALRLDGIPPIDSDLTTDEKKEFVALLNRYMPLEERALQLIKLAKFSDTKRAPVGLRAIQEINDITGLRGDRPTESTPMFTLPPDTKVNVTVTKVVK